MTDIEQEALALVNEVAIEECEEVNLAPHKTLCAALRLSVIEHEDTKNELSDFRQEVSDAVMAFMLDKPGLSGAGITRFIIPAKPDPLVRVINEVIYAQPHGDIDEDRMAGDFRAALEARGLEIKEKSK